MRLTWKDAAATLLTALAVAAYAATHEGWSVWLIGGSHRWAAVAIGLVGIGACSMGSPAKDTASRLLGALGAIALALFVIAVVTASLTPLSLLVADVVALWVLATARHAFEPTGRPVLRH